MYQGLSPLKNAFREELPAGLSLRVQAALSAARIRQARMRHTLSLLSSGVSVISFASLFVSLKAFATAATASGFTAYASLLVSDSSVVSSHFMSFAEALAEALPSVETTITLALVSVFLVSLRSAVSFGVAPRMRTA